MAVLSRLRERHLQPEWMDQPDLDEGRHRDALWGLREPLPSEYDAVVSSLFLHHLTEEQAIELLRRMGTAGQMVLVNDLVRSRTGYLLAWMGTRLLSRSEVVHFDGPRSVEGAFTP